MTESEPSAVFLSGREAYVDWANFFWAPAITVCYFSSCSLDFAEISQLAVTREKAKGCFALLRKNPPLSSRSPLSLVNNYLLSLSFPVPRAKRESKSVILTFPRIRLWPRPLISKPFKIGSIWAERRPDITSRNIDLTLAFNGVCRLLRSLLCLWKQKTWCSLLHYTM